jgi:hypothetical protein
VKEFNSQFLPGGIYQNIPKKLWLNMDQTNVYFEPKTTTSISKKGSRTVSCKDSGTNQNRGSVCITVVSDSTILPPFFIFKGVPGKLIEAALKTSGVFGCAQHKGWFDELVGQKYIDQILKPYLSRYRTCSFIMLDHFKCHFQNSFVSGINQLGGDVDYIPAGYTCIL